nr:FAD-dependent oxidoreductase [Petrachloros mirabilis]
MDQRWFDWRHQPPQKPTVITAETSPLTTVDWDVVVCGGTLGIFMAAALAQRGWRVALLERGILCGRDQEWNISRSELQSLVALELLSVEELEGAIASEFNPNRIQFHQGEALWVKDVLNIGVDPVTLLETLKQRFLAAGGTLLEQAPFQGASIHPNGVQVHGSQVHGSQVVPPLTTRLLIDAMGHFSPIVAQARQGEQPDGICLVVGTCAQGIPRGDQGDLMVSFTPLSNHCQYFWEAFPARAGRTTYLFTYVDLHPQRPSLRDLMADYFDLLPEYQGVSLSDIQIQRALFGVFPSYRRSPLQFPWSRMVPIGDSSGSQSPLSFGGFGAMIRHLPRLITGIHEALDCDTLTQADLACLQPYQPNLSVTWLFQKAMRAEVGQSLAPNQINHLLTTIFATMTTAGEGVLQSFLRDVVQFPALTQTLLQVTLQHPHLIPTILTQVGGRALATWLPHYVGLGLYQGLDRLSTHLPASALLSPQAQYRWHRWREAWQFGSGQDSEPSYGDPLLLPSRQRTDAS